MPLCCKVIGGITYLVQMDKVFQKLPGRTEHDNWMVTSLTLSAIKSKAAREQGSEQENAGERSRMVTFSARAANKMDISPVTVSESQW